MNKWKYKQWFTGFDNNTWIVFSSYYLPTHKTHGMLFGFLFGGYKTRKEAIKTANYQRSNWLTSDLYIAK